MTFGGLLPLGPTEFTNATDQGDNDGTDRHAVAHNADRDRIDQLALAGAALEDAIAAGAGFLSSPYPTIGEAFGGMYVPARALTRALTNTARVKRVVVAGDSTASGNTGVSWVQGGSGAWAELLGAMLSPLYGPQISRGFRGVWTGEWAAVGAGFTHAAPTDQFDVAPWGAAGQGALYKTGSSGFTQYLRWLRPTVGPAINTTCNGVEIYWVDLAGGGTWQYRINGGAWTLNGQTRIGDNKLKKFWVPATNISTVDFAASSQAQTGAEILMCIAGLAPYTVDPTSASSGFVLENLGLAAHMLVEFVSPTSVGDPLAILDHVVSANALLPTTPDLTILGFTNDVVAGPSAGDATAFAANIVSVYNRVHAAGGDLLLWAPFEQSGRSTTLQATFRQTVHDFGAAHACAVIDFYEAWATALGVGWAAADTLSGTVASGSGLMDPTTGAVHAGTLGHKDQALRFRRLLTTFA